ncbi:MAG: hypothetical protein IH820_13180 [Bacteroidetes bacterium]|nr:hypothetical protein [Bacteroidota bacterium]
MPFTLDNLAAVLISGVLVLILVTMQFRAQQANQDRLVLYTAKKQTLSFADVLVRDLSNLGVEMPRDQRIGRHSVNGDGLTDTLRFSRVDTAGDTLNIEYRLVVADSIVHEDTTVLYQIERYENGVFTGGSTPTMRSFTIELLDEGGATIAVDLRETRQVRIGFVNVMPFGDPDDHYIPSTYWGTTLRPRSLNPHIQENSEL